MNKASSSISKSNGAIIKREKCRECHSCTISKQSISTNTRKKPWSFARITLCRRAKASAISGSVTSGPGLRQAVINEGVLANPPTPLLFLVDETLASVLILTRSCSSGLHPNPGNFLVYPKGSSKQVRASLMRFMDRTESSFSLCHALCCYRMSISPTYNSNNFARSASTIRESQRISLHHVLGCNSSSLR